MEVLRFQKKFSMNGEKHLPNLIEGYDMKDIFNCGETGLFYRNIGNKSFIHNNESGSGIKLSEDRITVLFTVSAARETMVPLVIGKAENSHYFRGIEKYSLLVSYKASCKAWMSTDIFKFTCTS